MTPSSSSTHDVGVAVGEDVGGAVGEVVRAAVGEDVGEAVASVGAPVGDGVVGVSVAAPVQTPHDSGQRALIIGPQ
jgi:outer membrane lipoprotein SlyB